MGLRLRTVVSFFKKRTPDPSDESASSSVNDWLVGWLCFTSHRQRGHLETAPHLLSLAKDVKLGFNTVPTGNRNPGPSRYTNSVGSYVMKKGLVFFFLVKAKTHWIMLAGTIKTQKN